MLNSSKSRWLRSTQPPSLSFGVTAQQILSSNFNSVKIRLISSPRPLECHLLLLQENAKDCLTTSMRAWATRQPRGNWTISGSGSRKPFLAKKHSLDSLSASRYCYTHFVVLDSYLVYILEIIRCYPPVLFHTCSGGWSKIISCLHRYFIPPPLYKKHAKRLFTLHLILKGGKFQL